MGKAKYILSGAMLALLTVAAWQIGAAELANYEFQDELRDAAALGSVRIGLAAPKSDDDLRNAVINKALSHDIVLDPNEITVERSGTPESPRAYLAVHYETHIVIPGYNLTLHFHPTGGSRQ